MGISSFSFNNYYEVLCLKFQHLDSGHDRETKVGHQFSIVSQRGGNGSFCPIEPPTYAKAIVVIGAKHPAKR